MKSKFSTFIISIVLVLITLIMILLGIIFYNELKNMEISVDPENFKTIISSENTIDKDIETPKIIENPFDDNSDIKEVDYSNVNIDKYFYDQLNDYEKLIYKAFESNKENMKTGDYKVEFGSSFSEILNKEDGQDELGRYYQSAIEAYTYDNPDVFYLSPNKMYLNIETTTRGSKTTYYVYMNNGNQDNYLIDEFSSKEQMCYDVFQARSANFPLPPPIFSYISTAFFRAATSAGVSSRASPGYMTPRRKGPCATRTSRRMVRCTSRHMRRIWRFRP